MKRSILIIFLFLIAHLPSVFGQMTFGFTMPPDVKRVEIPFTEVNNLIVIPVVLNNFLKLNFILDTGVDTPILTEIAYSNLLGIEYIREVIVSGAGLQDSIRAYVGQKVNFRLPGNVIGHNLNLLVLHEDYLKLSEKMGMDVHGIIGYDIFKKFIVEINYDDKILILHRPEKFKPRGRFYSTTMEIENSRPFIFTQINQEKVTDSVRLMIDTGASHALLIDVNQTTFDLPKKTILARLGTGLGGEIPGQIGRLDSFKLNIYEFKDIIVSIPETDAYGQIIKRGSRQGTLGGDVLSRLYPIFDYSQEKLYISKGRKYKSKFEFDMSGMTIAVKGVFLDSIMVEHVRPDSPAAEADIRVGDIILLLNGRSLPNTSLTDMYSILRRKPNYKIRLRILRDKEKIRKEFRLKRTI